MNRILAFVAFCLASYFTYEVIILFIKNRGTADLPNPTWKEWLIFAALTLIPPSIAASALIYLVKTS